MSDTTFDELAEVLNRTPLASCFNRANTNPLMNNPILKKVLQYDD
jgi:hypothetical protein